MENLIKIDPIAVKDKNDVVKALTILEKLGIKRMTEEQKKNYLTDETKKVDNYFMIQEADGGFRIQSHYIGFGISIESLEKQVNEIIKIIPDVCEKIESINKKKDDLEKQITSINEKFKEQIDNLTEELKINGESLSASIHIKEIK